MRRFLFVLIFIFSGLELFGQGSGTVEFVQPEISVAESAGDISVSVVRTKSNLLASSVEYIVTRSTATLDQDYSMTTQGTLNWGEGDESPKGINLEILDDAVEEADEEIIIQLLNPSAGTYVGAADTARVLISYYYYYFASWNASSFLVMKAVNWGLRWRNTSPVNSTDRQGFLSIAGKGCWALSWLIMRLDNCPSLMRENIWVR